jgi:uncharacterized protein
VRVVLDTNTILSTLLWGGVPESLLAAATQGRIELYTSEALLLELAEILPRAKFARRIQMGQRTPAQLLEQYRGMVEIIEPAMISPTVVADPDDDHVLACALSARADLIVSRDNRLLALKYYQRIPIINATSALQILEKISQEGPT